MKKVLTTIAALLVFGAAAAFAEDVPLSVTWTWEMDDPNVVAYRYQLDGEEASKWTQVGAQVRSYTCRKIDPTVDHTLFIQQSYDRIRWSISAASTITADTLRSTALAISAAKETAAAAPAEAAPQV